MGKGSHGETGGRNCSFLYTIASRLNTVKRYQGEELESGA